MKVSKQSEAESQRILFIYNTGTYLYRMRKELLVELLQAGHEVVALFPFDEGTERLRALGVRCEPLKMTAHSIAPWRELATFISIGRDLKRIEPTVVFAFTIKPVVYAGLWMRWRPRNRFAVMITGLGMMFAVQGVKGRIARSLATALYRRSLVHAHCVFMQNEVHADAFLDRRLVSPAQLEVISGSGVNLELFKPVPIPVGEIVFVMISRILKHKGVFDFIAAAREFVKNTSGSGRRAKFILAGPIVAGPYAISETELARALADSPVTYVGEIDDVDAALGQSTVVVLPSSYPEGVPRILLEALAVGRPLLTTNTPGCRNTVEINDLSDCYREENNNRIVRENGANDFSNSDSSLAAITRTINPEPVQRAPGPEPVEVASGPRPVQVASGPGPVQVASGPGNPDAANAGSSQTGYELKPDNVPVRPRGQGSDRQNGSLSGASLTSADSAANGKLRHGIVGRNGVLCRASDVPSLVSCMRYFDDLPRRQLESMGQFSRDLAEARFDVRRVNEVIKNRLFSNLNLNG